MESSTYAQINYNPDDLDDVSVTEVDCQALAEESVDDGINKENVDEHPVTDESAIEEQELTEAMADEDLQEIGKSLEKMAEETAATVERDDDSINETTEMNDETKEVVKESEVIPEESEETHEETVENASEESADTTEGSGELVNEEKIVIVPDEVQDIFSKYLLSIEDIQRTLRRLENKFSDEVLNGENRDSAVKTMYKELNEYKAGIVEKALKNVLYDIVDIRETMLSQIKYLREKTGADTISLDEFESYADDIADILEKHDVTIYKGDLGEENIAVRQKIVRKVETEDDELVKKVAESLSYGYEFGSKILYPEKISVYVKKK